MQQELWLELTLKHAMTPEEITDEELASLRSNPEIWDSASALHVQTNKTRFAQKCRDAIGQRVLDPEDWKRFTNGEFIPEGISEDAAKKVHEAFREFSENIAKFQLARSHRNFLRKFDELVEKETGEAPKEIQEILWKTKAERLYKAIEEHRRAHVLANKQPNGLDFQLWSEANLDEFNASRHAKIQQGDHMTFFD